MIERDWRHLFLIALSHGTYLSDQRLPRLWFRHFVDRIGFSPSQNHKTGVSPLFLDLLWNREVGEEIHHCTYDQFVVMLKRISARCYQANRSAELLQRVNEKRAIVMTSIDHVNINEALLFTMRKYFSTVFERSMVARDSVITLDDTRNTLTPIANAVVQHVFEKMFNSLILPIFEQHSSSGFMSYGHFESFIATAFSGNLTPATKNYAKAIFCQVNIVDTKGLVQQNVMCGEELEFDEFLDVLMLLGVLYFAEEAKFPNHKSVESKVWGFLEILAEKRGVPMCPVVEAPSDLIPLRPRIGLVFPSKIPINEFTGFVVGGINLELCKKARPLLKSDTAEATGDVTAPQQTILPSPSANQQMRSESPTAFHLDDALAVSKSTTIRKRQTSNKVSGLSSKLFAHNFNDPPRVSTAAAVQHSKILQAIQPNAEPVLPVLPGSALSVQVPPVDAFGLSLNTPKLPQGACRSPRLFTAPSSPLTAATTTTLSIKALALKLGPGPSHDPQLFDEFANIGDLPSVAHYQNEIHFTVDGVITTATQVARNRVRLCVPSECLQSTNYRPFAEFKINDDTQEISALIRRERIVQIQAVVSSTGELLNQIPLTIGLKPVEMKLRPYVVERLGDLFEKHAPTSRMDMNQFVNAISEMRNVPKQYAADAFQMFASNSNNEFNIRLSHNGEVSVDWSVACGSMLGAPKMVFLTFLHAVGFLYLDKINNPQKIPNIQRFFELAFEDGEPVQHTTEKERRRRSIVARAALATVPALPELAGVNDGRLEVPYQRALKFREDCQREGEEEHRYRREQFHRKYNNVPPAPYFPKEDAGQTPLAIEIQRTESVQRQRNILIEGNPCSTGQTATVGQQPPTESSVAHVPTQQFVAHPVKPSVDVLTSYQQRSLSMRQEYFTAHMVRTLK